ncbi:DUF3341 domain-containing protein [Pelagicoccus sp. SDUM812005]|uniref:DUF3341 domain-containing protein n=1 Tax=Pelagicoccus sp. SDUM812005 TaxID=3041257 RepID=UPI00280CDD1D|nr:DUF3341 domain-containing protein [Pelagicoccus sp. SDUM812005]MDQ8181072.1 DUF3341 domain-containing protein [Pelagicoccus sp. SDUM812005]
MGKEERISFDSGIMARFEAERDLKAACSACEELGVGPWEAFTPYGVDGIEKPGTESAKRSVSKGVLVGACLALAIGYALFYYSSVVDYPYRVGGRPVHSWPAFVPMLFELAVLGGALTAVGLALFGNGMPAWAHPVFYFKGMEDVTGEGLFLWVSCEREGDFEQVESLLREARALSWERKEHGK